jgi:hypothetical protein
MRRDTRSMRTEDLLPRAGFIAGRLTAPVLAVLLAMVLLPVASAVAQPMGAAAQLLKVVITDPGGANQATVDMGGNLRIAGDVTVDSSTPVATTSSDDPGRMAFQSRSVVNISSGPGLAAIAVPTGNRLVITHVSGSVDLPSGQRLIDVRLEASAAGLATHHFVPSLTGTESGSGRPVFVFSQDTVIYHDQEELFISLFRSHLSGQLVAEVAVSGYLIDCSVAPCN